MNKKQIVSTLQDLKEEIAGHYKAKIVGIFGSYARGEENSASDLDVLAEFNKDATLLDAAGLRDFLEERLQIKVDLVSQRAVRREIGPSIYRDLISV